MRRHSPMPGASSMAPFSLMHSACTPARGEVCLRVTSGIFGGDHAHGSSGWGRRCPIISTRVRRPKAGNGRYRGRRAHRVSGEVEFHQDVVAGDPHMRRAEGDEGGDVEAPHPDDAANSGYWW